MNRSDSVDLSKVRLIRGNWAELRGNFQEKEKYAFLHTIDGLSCIRIRGEHVPGITREKRGHNWDTTPVVKELLQEYPWVDPIPFVRKTTEGSKRIRCCYISIIEGSLLTPAGREHYRWLSQNDVLHEALELSGYSLGT